MANVTYLLGAGASCNALPTYQNFAYRFKLFVDLFDTNGYVFSKVSQSYKNDARNLFELLQLFQYEFKYHNTPDTIAKKIFHTNGSEDGLTLKIVKQLLILFFLYEQIVIPESVNQNKGISIYNDDTNIKDSIDKRYDALIASLLKPIQGELNLLNQFNILTWNYDLQFELTFSNYLGFSGGLKNVQNHIQSYPRIYDNSLTHILDDFSIIHLNGIAFPKDLKNFRFELPINHSEFLAEQLIDVYKEMNRIDSEYPVNTKESLLTFAWENMKHDYSIQETETLKNAYAVAERTEYLVIIGYSFPIFNSIIDTELLRKMENVSKVYIQSPDAYRIEKILNDGVMGQRGAVIEDVGYTTSFYIPNEWRRTSMI